MCFLWHFDADEIKELTEQLKESRYSQQQLTDELARLRVELNDIKTATMISESGRQDDVDALKRKYMEEAASLQHIMKGRCFFFCLRIRLPLPRYST